MNNSPCQLYWTKSANNLFKKLPKNIQKQLKDEILNLRIKPENGSCLKGKYKSLRSLHVAISGTAYRVIYMYNEINSEITIVLTATRENIYKKLDGMRIIQ